MSLASIAFSRLATKVITPLSWASSSVVSSTFGGSSYAGLFLQRGGPHQQQQNNNTISIRSVFSEVIRQIPSDDPKKQGALTFEDPDLADARIGRNIRGECKFVVEKNLYIES